MHNNFLAELCNVDDDQANNINSKIINIDNI